jgi:hypothetical protein
MPGQGATSSRIALQQAHGAATEAGAWHECCIPRVVRDTHPEGVDAQGASLQGGGERSPVVGVAYVVGAQRAAADGPLGAEAAALLQQRRARLAALQAPQHNC